MTDQVEQLQNQLKELEHELAKIKTDKLRAEKEYRKTLDKVLEIRKQIDELEKVTNCTIRVTDHAIIRYMQRFKNLDTKPIIDDITSRIDMESLKKLGGTCVFKLDDMRIVLDNYTVITVTEKA